MIDIFTTCYLEKREGYGEKIAAQYGFYDVKETTNMNEALERMTRVKE